MSRARSFDTDVALDKAMRLFWRKGYLDTSIDDLVSETGVGRSGLYGTFGGKRDLFFAALTRYRNLIHPLVAR